MDKLLISKRYRNDNHPSLKVNDLQIDLIEKVKNKIKNNVYQYEDTNCCICAVSQEVLISEKDRYGFSHDVLICKRCGLIFTNPRFTQDTYNLFYNEEYRELYHGYNAPYENLFNGELNAGKKISFYLERNGFSLRDKTVYEVGCGAGGILKYLKDVYNCKVKGCDFGSDGIEYGIQNYQLDLRTGGIDSFQNDEKPDIIIYHHVLEHILNIADELKKVYNLLQNDGILFVNVPGVKNLRFKYSADYLRYFQNAHTYYFSLQTLSNLMQKNNFKCELGNDEVIAVFSKDPSSKKSIINDYDEQLKYIRNTDRFRFFYRTISFTYYFARNFLRKCLYLMHGK